MHTLDWWHTSLVTGPASEPVTKSDMKDHLPLDGTDHDDLLDTYITTARLKAEAHQKRQLIDATWKLFMSAFPVEIRVPFPPLSSVTHVKYYDTGGTQQTLTVTTDYQIDTDSEPGRIKPAHNKSWPSIRAGIYGAVEVQFVAGYGSAGSDVPATTKQAIKVMVADMYRIRENVANVTGPVQDLLSMETAEWFA